MMKKFSVVIPLFNKVAHIRRAIDSVLKQSFPDFELIVVNDGSWDGSDKVVHSFSDQRVNLINLPNRGAAAARNAGIAASSCSYIAFLDADDEWDSHFLLTIQNLIEAHPDAGAHATRIRYSGNLQNDPQFLRFTNGICLIDDILPYFFLDSYPLSSSSTCVRKSTLDAVGGFNESLYVGEDLDFWIRICRHSGCVISEQFAATYHMDANNRSAHRHELSAQELRFVSHMYHTYLSKTTTDIQSSFRTWISLRAYKAIARSIRHEEKLSGIKTLIHHWPQMRAKHRTLAALRLTTPLALLKFIKRSVGLH